MTSDPPMLLVVNDEVHPKIIDVEKVSKSKDKVVKESHLQNYL